MEERRIFGNLDRVSYTSLDERKVGVDVIPLDLSHISMVMCKTAFACVLPTILRGIRRHGCSLESPAGLLKLLMLRSHWRF